MKILYSFFSMCCILKQNTNFQPNIVKLYINGKLISSANWNWENKDQTKPFYIFKLQFSEKNYPFFILFFYLFFYI